MAIVSNSPLFFPILGQLQFEAYLRVITVVAVGYDFLLTFGREVEYVFNRPRSLMSLLYVVVRYLGITTIIFLDYQLIYMIIVDGDLPLTEPVRLRLYDLQTWGPFVTGIASDGIMILRLYAMYEKSRKILIFLLVCFVARVVALAVILGLATGPGSGISATEYLLSGTYFCSVAPNITFVNFTLVPTLFFELILFALASRCFVRHAAELRRSSHGWRMNECMKVLLRDSILFFVMNLAAGGGNVAIWINQSANGSYIYAGIGNTFLGIEPFLLAPRLVLSFRAYHEQLVVDSDMATQMESLVFQARGRVDIEGGWDASVERGKTLTQMELRDLRMGSGKGGYGKIQAV
ncbi:hypothetical protein BJ138DRAFT_1151771 [Hygrophoropsis aurantiaca]|uniref:Uncharacterized protein n=1 Tax=Hygrophoropsis aurantiaca TaxID=72124 RepID=A0ACB8ACP5_9AGAM|nr:hypothetical protein BJ138DRAFT_1151771 [Hygrophoropsis aurantiaca]